MWRDIFGTQIIKYWLGEFLKSKVSLLGLDQILQGTYIKVDGCEQDPIDLSYTTQTLWDLDSPQKPLTLTHWLSGIYKNLVPFQKTYVNTIRTDDCYLTSPPTRICSPPSPLPNIFSPTYRVQEVSVQKGSYRM